MKKNPRKSVIFAITVFGFTLFGFAGAQTAFRNFNDAWGPRYRPSLQIYTPSTHPMPHGIGAANRIRHWNEIAINASGLDHTPVAMGENRVFGEQFGPTRASRAMAIVHIAIFEAVNAIAGGYQSYAGLSPAPNDISMNAAIAQAASFEDLLAEDLSQIRDSHAKINGIDLGRRVAAAILALRANDGSQHAEPRVGIDFITSDEVGKWRQDPISQIPLALGAYW